MLPSLDAENHCPTCKAYLIIKFAAGGQSSGHRYIQCISCRYFYSFPLRDAPPTVSYVPAPPGWSAPTTLERRVSTSRKPKASPLPKPVPLPCVNSRCTKNATSACPHQLCKLDCVLDKDGCTLPTHTPEHLTENQRKKYAAIVLRRPSSTPHAPSPQQPRLHLSPERRVFRSLSPFSLNILDDAARFVRLPRLPPTNMLEIQPQREAQETDEDALQDEELAYLSTDIEAINAHNLSIGLALSTMPASSDSSSHPPASSSASTSRLSRVSSSSSTSRLSVPTRPLLLTPVVPVGKPAAKPGPAKPQPKRTTQMSATWMREFRDNTAEDTIKLRNAGLELTKDRTLLVAYWGFENQKPAIKIIQDPPHFPFWAVNESKQFMIRMCIEADVVEWYDPKLGLWIETEIGHLHALTKRSHLLLRRVGLDCYDFDTTLAAFSIQPVNIRKNMPAERRAVRQQLKKPIIDLLELSDDSDSAKPCTGKGKRRADDDDDEVEFVGSIKRQKVRESSLPSTKPSTSLLPSLDNDEDDEIERISFLQLLPTPPSTSRGNSETSTSTSTALSDSVISAPTTVATVAPSFDLRPFPVGFYTTEIAAGFRSMESPELKHMAIPDRLIHVFRRPNIKKNTYNDARQRWKLATQDQRGTAIKAGSTALGLWTTFARQIPLRK
ncbi:hypothetical protein C8J57DRAFT_1734698 [Mycena rebaudengoi]|nr:hypothetical protein C8J57DRAFT_1734698 [Mycena rebaudengoi]